MTWHAILCKSFRAQNVPSHHRHCSWSSPNIRASLNFCRSLLFVLIGLVLSSLLWGLSLLSALQHTLFILNCVVSYKMCEWNCRFLTLLCLSDVLVFDYLKISCGCPWSFFVTLPLSVYGLMHLFLALVFVQFDDSAIMPQNITKSQCSWVLLLQS